MCLFGFVCLCMLGWVLCKAYLVSLEPAQLWGLWALGLVPSGFRPRSEFKDILSRRGVGFSSADLCN